MTADTYHIVSVLGKHVGEIAQEADMAVAHVWVEDEDVAGRGQRDREECPDEHGGVISSAGDRLLM